jgi:hypothetical protein
MFNCITAVLSAGLYLVFAGTVSVSEVIVAVLVGALLALWSALLRRHTQNRFQFSAVLYKFVSRAPGLLLSGAHRTSTVLLQVCARSGYSPGTALRVAWIAGAPPSSTPSLARGKVTATRAC